MSIRLIYSDMGGGKSRITNFLYWLRTAQNSKNRMTHYLARLILAYHRNKYGIEISWRTKIGKGLYIGHAHNIIINPNAFLGDNCNVHYGVVIGQTNRGQRKGVPTIGNEVWIGINAVVVGNITIGDDVLIAPNSFVNVDIPSHSVVLGNPCVIKHRDNATEGYINKKAE